LFFCSHLLVSDLLSCLFALFVALRFLNANGELPSGKTLGDVLQETRNDLFSSGVAQDETSIAGEVASAAGNSDVEQADGDEKSQPNVAPNDYLPMCM
jgi:hypothetical protein